LTAAAAPGPTELRLAPLRQGFDAGFAEAPAAEAAAGEAVLTLRLRGEPFALRLSAIGGLAKGRRVVRLPQSPPGFAGFSSLRGRLLPVWDLAALLGLSPAGDAPWQALAAGPTPWALAFERFDGCLTLDQGGFHPYAGGGPAAAFARQAAWGPDGPRPVLELALLQAGVLALTSSTQEHRSP
jgi:purine-binding chemotaxis protein CheW